MAREARKSDDLVDDAKLEAGQNVSPLLLSSDAADMEAAGSETPRLDRRQESIYSGIRSSRRNDTAGSDTSPAVGKMFSTSGCRRARLKYVMSTPKSTPKSAPVERDGEAAEAGLLYRRATPLEPCIAVKRLLGHVHFDVDGGILNLHNDSLEFDANLSEVTKVPMLKKNPCEISIAIVTILRVLMNAGCILWEGRLALMHYALGTELSARMQEASGWHSLHLPMLELFVAVKMIEVVAVVGMLIVVIWDAVCIFFSNHGRYAAMVEHADQRYHRLVRIWWEIYPELQNFSALRCLEFVHPALIGKNFAQVMMTRHQAARALLERFLKIGPDLATDEELLDTAAKVLIQCDLSGESRQVKYDMATHYLHEMPGSMLNALVNSEGLQKVASGEREVSLDVDVDTEALSLYWRVRLYTVVTFLRFLAMAVICAVAGWLGFVVKLCSLAALINSSTTPVYQGVFRMIVFLNQMVGIVSLRHLLISRIRSFAFGGCDGIVSAEEQYLLNVYLAILQQKIWNSTALTYFHKVALMVQFDDRDLQELMVEEDPLVKSDVVLSVKQHMHETGLSNPGRLLSWVRGGAQVQKKN